MHAIDNVYNTKLQWPQVIKNTIKIWAISTFGNLLMVMCVGWLLVEPIEAREKRKHWTTTNE